VSVATNDNADAGSFTVKITGTIANAFGNIALTQSFKLTVLADPCGSEDLKLANANQADIIFQFGQEVLMNTFSFSDNEGGACWADWTYDLYAIDTKEKVEEAGLKRNGVKIDYDPEAL
jgi:hypothetical protein